jgi:hypothetical protein
MAQTVDASERRSQDMMMRLLAITAALALFAGCSRSPTPDAKAESRATPAATREAPQAKKPPRGKKGGTDVTFFVVSDTHFGFGYPDDLATLSANPFADPVGLEKNNKELIAALNALPGHDYPADVGGKVAPPRGLLVTGDLTEWGREEEWKRFVAFYGKTGEGPLKFPVFEVIGNHDKVHGPWVEQQVSQRHGGRFYSFDWDDLHVVALGEAPDDEGLAFLARDFETIDGSVPVVLYFHLALEGPWSTEHWFAEKDYKSRLATLVASRNVVAIFHGHHHATGHYVWHGVDVYKPGAVKHDAHTVAVVHVTDDKWALGSWDWRARRFLGSHVKSLR